MPELLQSFTAHVRRAWHGEAKHRGWGPWEGTEPQRVWGSAHPAGSHLPVDLALFQASDAVPVQRALLIKFPERPRVGSKAWGEVQGPGSQTVAGPQAARLPRDTEQQLRPLPGPTTPARPYLRRSVKKLGLSAWTMTTSKSWRQSGPTMCRIPLSLGGEGPSGAGGRGRLQASATQLESLSHFRPQRGQGGLHEAERAVGDEEQLLPMGHQAAQHGKRLIPSQDVLLWEVRGVGEKGAVRAGPAPAPGSCSRALAPLTHVPLDPLVHEALHVHVSDGILGAAEGQ